MTYIIIIFILGLIIGSFLNVLICRLPDLKSIASTRSYCPQCKHSLSYVDMIPVFSFLLLSGHCKYCRKNISWQYPLVEIATALLFVALYLQFGLTFYSVFQIIVSCCLIVVFVYDAQRQLIPDEMLLAIVFVTIIYYISQYKFFDFTNILIAIFIPILLTGAIVFLSKGKGMGIGDIKLSAVLGLVLGYPNILIALFVAFVVGAIYGIIAIIAGKNKLKDAIAFGPFLIIGFYITLFWGQNILNWYLKI